MKRRPSVVILVAVSLVAGAAGAAGPPGAAGLSPPRSGIPGETSRTTRSGGCSSMAFSGPRGSRCLRTERRSTFRKTCWPCRPPRRHPRGETGGAKSRRRGTLPVRTRARWCVSWCRQGTLFLNPHIPWYRKSNPVTQGDQPRYRQLLGYDATVIEAGCRGILMGAVSVAD